MQNLIKLAIWAAPAFVLALIIILGRTDKQNAEFEVDAARFDRQFAQQLSDFTDKKDFWQKEKEDADHRLETAENELALAKGKVSQQLEMLEKSINKMDQENKK